MHYSGVAVFLSTLSEMPKTIVRWYRFTLFGGNKNNLMCGLTCAVSSQGDGTLCVCVCACVCVCVCV